MSSSSTLAFRVPSRDNFAEARSAESKAATKVTVTPYVAEASTTPATARTKESTTHLGSKVGVHLNAKA
jgi:hypothetical protein